MGVIYFHVHAGPDSRPRSLNDTEVARQFKQAGLWGMVLKNHFTMTADRAVLAMAQTDLTQIGKPPPRAVRRAEVRPW